MMNRDHPFETLHADGSLGDHILIPAARFLVFASEVGHRRVDACILPQET
jgi:hypothetical protein